MQLTGAQIVCESLLQEGVDTIFGIPGGAILPLYQTLPEYPGLKHILAVSYTHLTLPTILLV